MEAVMRILSTSLVVAILATAAAGCGGNDGDGGQQTAADDQQTNATSRTETQAASDRVERIRTALADIVAECTARRTRGERRRVGQVSRDFRESLDVLLEEHRKDPKREVRLREGNPPTTVERQLRRVSATLQRPTPEGCGASNPERTRRLVGDIRKALGATPES